MCSSVVNTMTAAERELVFQQQQRKRQQTHLFRVIEWTIALHFKLLGLLIKDWLDNTLLVVYVVL